MGLFDGIFSAFSSKPAQDAAQARIQGLNNAQAAGTAGIDTGLNQLNSYYQQAGNLYQPLAAMATKRTGALDDATGVNGAEGLARAKALFTATPGYQSGMDMSLDQLDRRAASRGMLGSGNLVADTSKLATDYSNQRYGDYVSRLQPYMGQDMGVAGQQAGILTGQGNKAYEGGALKGGIGYQTAQGIGNANADAAMAPYNTSQNFWNTLLGVGKLATGVAKGF